MCPEEIEKAEVEVKVKVAVEVRVVEEVIVPEEDEEAQVEELVVAVLVVVVVALEGVKPKIYCIPENFKRKQPMAIIVEMDLPLAVPIFLL